MLDIERGQLADIRPLFWQTDTSVSKNSWGYVTNETFKTTDSIVDHLVDIVSKNGCLLLNIGPQPDGTIPGAGRADPARDRPVAGGQRRGDLRHPALEDFRRGPDQGHGRIVQGHSDKAFTGADIRFTTKGPHSLRDRLGVAGQREARR